MSTHRPLTRLAHARLAEHLSPGDIAIDATAGNGHDTLFLARRVGPEGQVHAFDVQPRALAATRERLAASGCETPVRLYLESHARMQAVLPAELAGRVAAVTFNLGYLPGSDHAVVTARDSTLEALAQALALLRPGGLLSVLAYRGHPGGETEARAVATWLAGAPGLRGETIESPGPVLHLAWKHADNTKTADRA